MIRNQVISRRKGNVGRIRQDYLSAGIGSYCAERYLGSVCEANGKRGEGGKGLGRHGARGTRRPGRAPFTGRALRTGGTDCTCGAGAARRSLVALNSLNAGGPGRPCRPRRPHSSFRTGRARHTRCASGTRGARNTLRPRRAYSALRTGIALRSPRAFRSRGACGPAAAYAATAAWPTDKFPVKWEWLGHSYSPFPICHGIKGVSLLHSICASRIIVIIINKIFICLQIQ